MGTVAQERDEETDKDAELADQIVTLMEEALPSTFTVDDTDCASLMQSMEQEAEVRFLVKRCKELEIAAKLLQQERDQLTHNPQESQLC